MSLVSSDSHEIFDMAGSGAINTDILIVTSVASVDFN